MAKDGQAEARHVVGVVDARIECTEEHRGADDHRFDDTTTMIKTTVLS